MGYSVLRTRSQPAGESAAEGNQDTSDQAVAEEHLAWALTEARGRTADPYRYVLILRFALVNLMALSLLGALYVRGLVDLVFTSDRTGLSLAICVVFLGGLGFCAWRVFQTSRELNSLREFDPLMPSLAAAYLALVRGRSGQSRSTLAAVLRLKLSNRVAVVRHVANSLVLLGLVGTVIGFIIALSGVDPGHVSEVDAIAPMVSKLIEGMSVALYTTLVGAVLNLWLMVTYHILATGTVKLITGLIEFGESHGRA